MIVKQFVRLIALDLVSLLKVVRKKYICCLVKVDKLWEEKGVVLCRVAPDTYNNHDFTGAITVKNFTKTPENVKEGDQIIVVAGNFSRYIYLFDYVGDKCVTERRNITVTKDESFVPSAEYDEKYPDAMGLRNIPFGPYKVQEVEFNVSEELLEETMELLDKVYENSEQILAGLYELIFAELNKEAPEMLRNNRVDIHYIEKHFDMEQLVVRVLEEGQDPDDEIAFYGRLHDDDYEEVFVGKTFRIGISLINDDVTYELDYF